MIYNTLFVLLKKKYCINISFVVFVICCALGLSILSTSNFATKVGDSCNTPGLIGTDFVCTCVVSLSNVNTCKDTATHFCYENGLYPKYENGGEEGCLFDNWCTSGKCEKNVCVAVSGAPSTCTEDTATHFCYENGLYPKYENGNDDVGCLFNNWCKSGKCEKNVCVAAGGADCPLTSTYEVPDCTSACDNTNNPGCPCMCKSTCSTTGVVKSGEVCGTTCTSGAGAFSLPNCGSQCTTSNAGGYCKCNCLTTCENSQISLGESCGGAEKTYQCFVISINGASGHPTVSFTDNSDNNYISNQVGVGYLVAEGNPISKDVKTIVSDYSCPNTGASSVGNVTATNKENARALCKDKYTLPPAATNVTCTKTKQCVNACSSDFCENNIAYYCTTNAQGCKVKGNTIPKPTFQGKYFCENGRWKCSGSVKFLTSCFSICDSCQCTCPSNCVNTGFAAYSENCGGQTIYTCTTAAIGGTCKELCSETESQITGTCASGVCCSKTLPSKYPMTITRTYSFIANNQNEEILLKDFLGIDPPGDDIDTYLSTRTNIQLDNWRNYWLSKLLGHKKFINSMYNEYYHR
ncbi:MAG: hypothetical protein CVU81_01690 [Euryarchaeota archaeon HGW-Euryarchaeota-1]|nr:MAG: hypothetical protein CVU81_01690 [Euryarchaeota archaeon HGW-Euryarchaeota-1]